MQKEKKNAHTCTHFTTLNILIRKYCEMDIDLEKKVNKKKGRKKLIVQKKRVECFNTSFSYYAKIVLDMEFMFVSI